MHKNELKAKMETLTADGRDALEAIITDGGVGNLPSRVVANAQIYRMKELGLIYESREGLKYDGGPISEFFEVRVEANFA